ncbi:hypothetical protein BGZ83_010285 [Gryganskiella cystojenkinii]|nr:hypothetical protein BGZ83_010285 [Gryganskiella cystojenkinii]
MNIQLEHKASWYSPRLRTELFYGLDLRASEEAFQGRSYNRAQIRSCVYSAQHSLVATRASEGVVELFDIRKGNLIFIEAKDAPGEGPRLIVGCDSVFYETKFAGVQIRREYVGYDLDGPCVRDLWDPVVGPTVTICLTAFSPVTADLSSFWKPTVATVEKVPVMIP